MNKISIILWILVIAYAVLPDLVVGPVDDTILIVLRLIIQTRLGI